MFYFNLCFWKFCLNISNDYKMTTINIYLGNIIHCTEPFTVHTIEKGFIIVNDKKIVALDNISSLESTKNRLNIPENASITTLTDTQFIIPGLIDTHIHAPQYPNAGLGYDMQLLDWLNTYTFSLEERYKDVHFAEKVYGAVVKRTLAHGTTTACYFATVHSDSSLKLVDAAIKSGQRAFIGKVNMNKLCPVELSEDNNVTLERTEEFVQKVLAKNNDLVKPIITPRFALSCDMDLMKSLGALAKKYDVHIQTHISENEQEIEHVKQTFHKGYADVYDTANLLTRKTVLAHGVHLETNEIKLLAKKGTSVAHCPASNNNLQSGMCDVKRLIHHGVHVGLGTDVAGGASPSIIDAMRCALNVSIHISFNDKEHLPLNCYDAFYLATLGGAKALALDEHVGNFEIGKDFDALIIDMDVKNAGVDFLHECTPLELLQKFVYLGDDRNVVKVFVAGKQVK